MMKMILTALCAGVCFAVLPAMAATPAAPDVAPVARDKSAELGVVRIGDRVCPITPDGAVSDKTKKMLTLLSTTCIMEASGMITHDEAQQVYQQGLADIQIALAEIETDQAPALASR